MSKNSVYAQTQSKDNYKADRKITAKHWKIYYYLLSVSKFNAEKVEDHRYVYRKDFNITHACRTLGIKSNQTFYNALKRLEEHRLIRVDETCYFLYARNWIEIDKNILGNLVKYSKTREEDIDLLRTFLILKKMNKIAENAEEKSFTLRQISILLGHGDTHPKYYENIRIYLALLSFWGLIELKQHKQYNKELETAYTIYHLQHIKENDLKPDFESDINAEMNAALPSEELMNKLRFCFPGIIEDK